MPKKNDLVRVDQSVYRVLELNSEYVLAIDCLRRTMPVLYTGKAADSFREAEIIEQSGLPEITGRVIEDFEKAPLARQSVAHKRYSLIASLLSVICDKKTYSKLLNDISAYSGISKQTIRRYLCDYLVFQDLGCLLPMPSASEKKELSADERNFRWALNKWFYNQSQHTLQWTYQQMLREKYCDENGVLLSGRPSFDRFRYFYRKTKSEQNYLISRNGIGDYKRNSRPLLGDCIQARFPNIGVGMLDGTICDIYLVDDSGKVIGRPVLTACIDANSSLCCGYCLSWEGGTYNLRNLMLNVISDKKAWCKRFNILINEEDWPCSSLPGVMITDKGSEYVSENFVQLTDLGVTLIDLEPFRPDLKPLVEKFFDIIQGYFKDELKGKGVVEKDFGERTNRVDYRKQACLTMNQFEQVLIRSIIYYNSERTLENYPYDEQMLNSGINPTAAGVWNYLGNEHGTNLISVERQLLSLVLLPRTAGKFCRDGLRVNKLRYVHTEGDYVDKYLSGGEVTVAYSPDNVSRVWFLDGGEFVGFRLIESRYKDMSSQAVSDLKERTRLLIRNNEEAKLQGRIDLSNHIRNIISGINDTDSSTKAIRENRQSETVRKHIEIGGDIS